MNKDALHNMRTDYKNENLSSSNLHQNPIEQFKSWFAIATSKNIKEPNAFSLATCSKNGQPQNRIVLVKEINEDGIVFYTNYDSQKGQQLEENPKVSACFFWQELSKQIRIEGVCEKISPKSSDAYFAKRPFESRVGAYTSPQSKEIPSREWLENKWKKNLEQLTDDFERPINWGGYLIKATKFEFWQGQPSRLHDRFSYQLKDGQWQVIRLAP